MNEIYMDFSATTPPRQEVIDAMMPYFEYAWHNPSSLYKVGAKVRQDIEDSRKIIASFIGAESEEIVFCPSGSAANCLAIRGFVDKAEDGGYQPIIITTQIEHKSIEACVDTLARRGVVVQKLDVDDQGFINIGLLETLLAYYCSIEFNKVLVSIQYANNEIGTIQNVWQIGDMAHKYGAVFHTDAVQAAGQIAIDVRQLGIDMMTVSGHKLGCPRGIAFLYKKNDIKIAPLVFGTQEQGLMSGTENSAGIVGLAEAVKLAKDGIKNRESIAMMRDYMIDKLEKIEGIKLNGTRANRLPNNINVQTGVNAESLLYCLDMSNVYISSGSACNSKSIDPSYVLKAIGLRDEEANSSIRLTISQDTTFFEVDAVVDEIDRCLKLLKGETIMWQDYE